MPVGKHYALSGTDGDVDEEQEIDPQAHAKLIDGINNVTGSHYIREVTRTEPTVKRSEFGLSKTKKDKVLLKDLSKFFKKTKTHTEVGRQLQRLKQRNPLLKPLDKPVAEKLKREEGYKKAQKRLDKWEPLVKATEVAPQVVFPLRYGSVQMHNEAPKQLSEYRVKTKLMTDLEELEKEYAGSGDDEEDDAAVEGRKYKLTLQEMRQQQMQRARQRVLESYKNVKGWRQNKIKSKKFHRLLKKDRLKEQIKKFEDLKTTNPEEALKQLNQIEKQRFQERATLRHKNTGTWAKNLQVRAKYNTDVRRELAEQLAIGRELTAKRMRHDESSSESEGEVETVTNKSGPNPWTEREMGDHERGANERQTMVSYYRKYWEERNRAQALKGQLEETAETTTNEENGTVRSSEDDAEDDGEINSTKTSKPSQKGGRKVKESVRMASGSWDVEDSVTQTNVVRKKKKAAEPKSKLLRRQNGSSATVEDLFQEAEELIQDALVNKLGRVQEDLDEEAKRIKRRCRKRKTGGKLKRDPTDLSFKKKSRLDDADVELTETAGREATGDSLVVDAPALSDRPVSAVASKAKAEINLKQVVQMKPKHLLTALPDTITSGELSDGEPENERDKQRLTIAEAFQDDDIVADFLKDKQDERQKDLPQVEDNQMPGWGAWAGPGVQPSQTRQNRRKIFKPPVELPRRDDNKDMVIINENAVNPKLTEHLVNELPFPFVTVKDYEASLRAPLGRTFVPETAHVTMIEPRVVTMQGTVIEPMSKKMLLSSPDGFGRRAPKKAGNKPINSYNEFVSNVQKGNLKI